MAELEREECEARARQLEEQARQPIRRPSPCRGDAAGWGPPGSQALSECYRRRRRRLLVMLVFAIRSAQVGRLEAEVPALRMQVALECTPPPTRPLGRVLGVLVVGYCGVLT